MLPTPDTSHVSFANVYEPSEDSFLLLDTLSSPSETAFLQQRFASPPRPSSVLLPHGQQQPSPSPVVLEVGTGSGVVLAFAARNAVALFGRPDVVTLGTDVNPFACRAAAQTVAANLLSDGEGAGEAHGRGAARAGSSMFLDCVRGDLASAVRPRSVDVLLFNPPYVPSERVPAQHDPPQQGPTAADDPGLAGGLLAREDAFQRDMALLALATDGGEDGMEVTSRLLAQLPEMLSEDRGVAYVLLCARNRPEEVKQRIQTWVGGWTACTVGRSGKTGGWEQLEIVRIARDAVRP